MIKLIDQNGNVREVMSYGNIDGRAEFIEKKGHTPQILSWRIDQRDQKTGKIVVTGPTNSSSHTVVYYPCSKGYQERVNRLNVRSCKIN